MVRTCKFCGKEFEGSRKQQYCREACRSKKYYRQKVEASEKRIKKCEKCGKEFEPHHGDVKYCSEECRQKAKAEKAKAYGVRYGNPVLKKCEHCGKEFKTASSTRKYCSKACRLADYEAKRHALNFAIRKCEMCGKKFHPIRYNQKYCSVECRRGEGEPLSPKKCEHCGKEFEPLAGNQKYCNCECAYEAKQARARKWYAARHKLIKKKCEHCGKEFKTTNSTQKYCSEACQRTHSRYAYRKRVYEKAAEFAAQIKANPEPIQVKPKEEVKEKKPRVPLNLGFNFKVPHGQVKRKCRACGAEFLADVSGDRHYCSLECFRSQQPGANRKPTRFEVVARQADECGLSYGMYRAQLSLGKTYEELKAAYDKKKIREACLGF